MICIGVRVSTGTDSSPDNRLQQNARTRAEVCRGRDRANEMYDRTEEASRRRRHEFQGFADLWTLVRADPSHLKEILHLSLKREMCEQAFTVLESPTKASITLISSPFSSVNRPFRSC